MKVPDSMQEVIGNLKLWSLLVFPGVGYAIGNLIKFCIAIFLGWKHSPSIEIWITHFLTMGFLIGTLNTMVFTPNASEDPKEKAFFICFNYLGLFGLILGLVPS